MKLTTNEGIRRYWGVAHRKHRSAMRAKFTKPDGDFDHDRFSRESMDRAGMMGDFDQLPDPLYKVTPGHYVATIRIYGKLWHIAKSAVPAIAARRYDEALFHLWGFRKSPKARFNFYKNGDAIPLCPPRVLEIRRALRKFVKENLGLSPDFFDYNFLHQQNPTIK